MSKAKRALIDSLTPENRNVLLLLQMRMGVYTEIEAEICKRVNVIRHGGKEYLCPAPNPSIMLGIDMNMRPLQLNAEGHIFLSPVTVQLDGTSEYVGMLDVMVSGAELREGMRRQSVERKGVQRAGLAVLSEAMLAEVGTYSSATKAMATGRGRLNEADYFHRKMHLGIQPKGYVGRTPIIGFWTRMGWKWGSLKARTARRFHNAIGFVRNLFQR